MIKMTRVIISDILRNKVVVSYTILLAILSWCIFSLEDTSDKAQLTLLNFVLLVVPLVSVLVSAIYFYNNTEFIELLLTQPLKRRQIWTSFFAALSISLVLAFLLATGIPLLIYISFSKSWLFILSGCLISLVFIALGMLAAIYCRDKAKGIGLAIIIWIYFSLLFDGMVLFLLFQFSDYPIEKPIVLLTATNPIDLARIINLLQLDATALLGFTGAVFNEYFGTPQGILIAISMLLLWVLLPFYFSSRIFKKRDL